MKNWKRLAAIFGAVMVMGTMMTAPVFAEEEAAVEESSPEIQDATAAMLGLWQDNVGDIYGFYSDYSFFAQYVAEETDVVGSYSLVTEGTNLVLTLLYSEDEASQSYITADTENNKLILSNMETGEAFAEMYPYESQAAEDEVDYNVSYQEIGNMLTECYIGTTTAEETFVWAANEDGSYCIAMAIGADDSYASFVGAAVVEEDLITVTDDASGLSLAFNFAMNEDGNIDIDMGDAGSGTLEKATVADAIYMLKYVTVNGTPIA